MNGISGGDCVALALFIPVIYCFHPQPRITKLSNLCYTGAAARVIISLRGHYPLMRYLTQPDNCNICFYNRELFSFFSFFLETSKLFAPRYNRARLIMLNNPGAKISSLLTFSASYNVVFAFSRIVLLD